MADKWQSYISMVNDKVASILVDLSFWEFSPNPGLPVLGAVFVDMKSPREDGLSSTEEFETLAELEDQLEVAITELKGVFPGRLTSDGIRGFYFYLPSEEGFEEAVNTAMKPYPDYQFQLLQESDPDWTQYLEVLYPNPFQMRSISNRTVLDTLKGHGDIHSQPREVDHFVHFKSSEARKPFAEWAQADGFRVAEHDRPEDEWPLGLELTRTHAVDQDTIDEVSFDLTERAANAGGEYDGWGCPITPTPKKEEKPKKPQPKWFKKLFV